jgi:hypothetical protein
VWPVTSKQVYANVEQRPKYQPVAELTQQSIDTAFRRPARITSQHAIYEDHTIHILNGKHTGRLGVITVAHNEAHVPVTNIERTLIDATG